MSLNESMVNTTSPHFLITNSIQQVCLLLHRLTKKLRASLLVKQAYRVTVSSSNSHHVATERVEEFTPFGAAASSNGALHTPSRFSEHLPCNVVTWHKRCRQRAQYERNHTEKNYVVLRRRRSRLGATPLVFKGGNIVLCFVIFDTKEVRKCVHNVQCRQILLLFCRTPQHFQTVPHTLTIQTFTWDVEHHDNIISITDFSAEF